MSPNGQLPTGPDLPDATGAPGAALLVRTFSMEPGKGFATHSHAWHQLAWARSGVLVVSTSGGDWLLPPTRALWIPALVPHQVTASGRTTMRTLYLDAGPGLPDWTRPQPVAVRPLVAELIDHLSDPALDLGRRGRAQAVLVDNLAPVAAMTVDAPLPADDRARAVALALIEDPADPRTLDAWGRQVGASARTLARAFAQETGVGFARWRTRARLRAALPYLAEGQAVGRVAPRVGFATPSAFVAAFHRETGLTPGGYFRPDQP
jgi:AraC-like DNA-binding protein